MISRKIIYLIPVILLLLSACSDNTISFEAGDKQADFCGVHLNYQYCGCAFDGEFCEQVAMSKSEAKKHVDEQYDAWVEKESLNFKSNCLKNNGIYDNDKCKYCDDDEVVQGGKCKKNKGSGDDIINTNELAAGQCRKDNDCSSICEGNIKWSFVCNTEINECEKKFDTDCKNNMEKFGSLSFSMICSDGKCARDNEAIVSIKQELEKEDESSSEKLEDLKNSKSELDELISEANKNCQDAVVDISDKGIEKFTTRVVAVADKNKSLVASTSVDAFDATINKLSTFSANGKSSEYAKLNCELHDYLKLFVDEIDMEIDEIVDAAKEALNNLKMLP